MSAKDLVAAFNEAAGSLAKCERATLAYEHEDREPEVIEAPDTLANRPAVLKPRAPLQWQVLTFYGRNAAGPFVYKTERLAMDADLIAAAREAASKFTAG